MDYDKYSKLSEFRYSSESDETDDRRELRRQAGYVIDRANDLARLIQAYKLILKDWAQ